MKHVNYNQNGIREYIRRMEELWPGIKSGIEDLLLDDKNDKNEVNEIPEEPRTLEIGGAIFTNMPMLPDHADQATRNLGVQIRKVPKDFLGYRVLGRAFPSSKIIEIADDLDGDEFEEVKLHELLHVQNPYASEYDIRSLTRTFLGKTRWNR